MQRNLVLIRRVTVMVVVTMLLGAMTSTAVAQGTKGKKAAVTLEFYKDKGGKYRYRLKNDKGKSLAIASSGIKTKAAFMEVISTLQKYAAKGKVVEADKVASSATKGITFQLYKDRQGKYRFRILSNTGKSVGRSSIGYPTKTEVDNVIDMIRKTAAAAKVLDKS